MKRLVYILFLLSTMAYGQYSLDDTINTHPFLHIVDPKYDRTCSLYSAYYESLAGYGMSGTGTDCSLLQQQLKDSLRARFTNTELFEIAQYSKIPFYRIAAFELYSQTDYSKEEVIRFLKREKTPSKKGIESQTMAELYVPLPTPFLATSASIRLKMLDIIDPTATLATRSDSLPGYAMIKVPKYPKSKPLELEAFVSVKTYISYYCGDMTTGGWTATKKLKPGEKPKTSVFYLPYSVIDFGTIDLDYANAKDPYFELRGAIKVTNLSTKTITIYGQASAHTMCTNSNYVIQPKQEMMLEFKSLVDLHHPFIDRSITLTNKETGETQVFKFKAKFIHLKQ